MYRNQLSLPKYVEPIIPNSSLYEYYKANNTKSIRKNVSQYGSSSINDDVERDEKMQTSNHMTNAMGSDNDNIICPEDEKIVSDEDIDIENISEVS
ncbi:10940_t:CDS:1, partial [Funneliformis mosseae]